MNFSKDAQPESRTYRTNGAVGALLDEYERAIYDLKRTITGLSPTDLVRTVDAVTADEDCRSIQTILSHVIRAGHNYVLEIRRWQGELLNLRVSKHLTTVGDYQAALDELILITEKLFHDYPSLPVEIYQEQKKIKVSWGQYYDVEQLMEHAIVHVLRHRRQIERFMIA